VNDIPERDWKRMRALKEPALNRECERVLNRVGRIAQGSPETAHERYLKLWQLMKREDRTIGLLFDENRRSTALHTLANWYTHKVISDSQLDEFSEETGSRVRMLASL